MAWSQQQAAALERDFSRLEAEMAALTSRRSALTEKLNQNAVAIQELKQQDQLSFFKRQRLENLLKESQEISDKVTALDFELRRLTRLYRTAGNALITHYDAAVESAVQTLETAQLPERERSQRLALIAGMRAKRENIKRKIQGRLAHATLLTKIEIKPEDTPTDVRRKADLLKDQEDKFRRHAAALEQRRIELQKELNLRSRIDELVADLAVFDQQEETIGNLSAESVQTLTDESSALSGRTEGAFQPGDNILAGQNDFDFTELSSEQLEDIIAALSRQHRQAITTADSLGRWADAFHRAADKLKKE